MSTDIEILQKRLEREKLARKQAERIAEDNSRDLFKKSQALENALTAERKAKAELQVLFNTLKAFTSKLDPCDISERISSFINEACPSTAIVICFNLDGHFCSSRYIHRDGEIDVFRDIAFSESIWASINKARSHIVINRSDFCNFQSDYTPQSDSQSILVLPLFALDEIAGYIVVESAIEKKLADSIVAFLQAIAYQAATALENARLFQDVVRLSATDPLTGLMNRRSFDESAQRHFKLAIRHNKPLAALMLDVDFFKNVNDTYGHAAGDSVLIEVAKICQAETRTTDLIARFGGEEFCFLVHETDVEGAKLIGERVRIAIANHSFKCGSTKFHVTASVGISERINETDTLEQLITRSDDALYMAKNSGRNIVTIWQPSP